MKTLKVPSDDKTSKVEEEPLLPFDSVPVSSLQESRAMELEKISGGWDR